MRLTYRPISPEVDWELFKQRPLISDITPPSESALSHILPLDDASCTTFWIDVVTPDPEHVWYRQLPQNHWTHQLIHRGPNWYDVFDKWPRPDPIASFLQFHLNWIGEQRVYFVRSKQYVIQTLWSVFRDNWRSFLISDDDPFLLAPNQSAFALIGDSGALAIGDRPMPLALDD
jgi:hypothetical protein